MAILLQMNGEIGELCPETLPRARGSTVLATLLATGRRTAVAPAPTFKSLGSPLLRSAQTPRYLGIEPGHELLHRIGVGAGHTQRVVDFAVRLGLRQHGGAQTQLAALVG